ncbi:MAG: hypothetical protein GY702_05205 [Desulfobulbaceae bacterium]|nr:hypothetical protein [Desulfobulbaceae bacterium]
MNEPGALDERLRTLVMQSFERGGERLQHEYKNQQSNYRGLDVPGSTHTASFQFCNIRPTIISCWLFGNERRKMAATITTMKRAHV